MTQQQHLTTMKEQRAFPSEEVVKGWIREWDEWAEEPSTISLLRYIALKAADWQLEQVCDFLECRLPQATLFALRDAMRPKPKSLAEEATYQLDEAVMRGDCITITEAMPVLRAALERLKKLEAQQ